MIDTSAYPITKLVDASTDAHEHSLLVEKGYSAVGYVTGGRIEAVYNEVVCTGGSGNSMCSHGSIGTCLHTNSVQARIAVPCVYTIMGLAENDAHELLTSEVACRDKRIQELEAELESLKVDARKKSYAALSEIDRLGARTESLMQDIYELQNSVSAYAEQAVRDSEENAKLRGLLQSAKNQLDGYVLANSVDESRILDHGNEMTFLQCLMMVHGMLPVHTMQEAATAFSEAVGEGILTVSAHRPGYVFVGENCKERMAKILRKTQVVGTLSTPEDVDYEF